jgi:prepilin-type N-terminal cleavage/methylation domain-containing protein
MKRQKGFTLVELLIVIALLGALAIGLIGALDPFEQLKKGTDTGTRDLVNQVQTAVLRYYATTNVFPWDKTAALSAGFTGTALSDANFADTLANMITAGELKSNFNEIYPATKTKEIIMTYIPSGVAQSATVVACYQPQSKSFLVDPNTKYSNDGTTTNQAACKSQGGTDNCWWCVQ